MGFDITYHPLAEAEVASLWFDLLTNRAALKSLRARVKADEGAGQYIASLVKEAQRGSTRGDLKAKHLFPLAIVAGIVRPYWYVRGGAFSFCVEERPTLKKYLGSWRELVPEKFRRAPIADTLTSNDTVGCFIASSQVGALAEAIRRKRLPAKVLDRAFSHGRLAVFLRALDAADKQGRGLLEASEVVIPNPLGGEWEACLTRADHCRREGVALYEKAAAAQLTEVLKLIKKETRPKTSPRGPRASVSARSRRRLPPSR